MGLLFGQWIGGWRRPALAGTAVVALAIALAAWPLRPALAGPCLRETDYYCIRVRDEMRNDGAMYRVLTLDRLVHSYSSLDDPRKLAYGYEKISAEVTAPVASGFSIHERMKRISSSRRKVFLAILNVD